MTPPARVLPPDAEVAALLPGARRDDSRGGPLDLAAAALLEPDPHHERARLITRGFLDGCARWWDAPRVTAQMTVLRLGGDDQAALSVLDVRDTMEAAGMSVSAPGRRTTAMIRSGEPISAHTNVQASFVDQIICAQMDSDHEDDIAVATAAVGPLHLIAVVAVEPDGDPGGTALTLAVALIQIAGARATGASGGSGPDR